MLTRKNLFSDTEILIIRSLYDIYSSILFQFILVRNVI